jgi:hypothetical protein
MNCKTNRQLGVGLSQGSFFMKAIFGFCFGLSLLLTGCSKESAIRASIVDSPCEPPCWQNISPGVTNRDEVYDLLMEVPGVNQGEAGWHGKWNMYDDLLHWKAEDIKANGEIYIVDGFVTQIVLYGDLGLSLNDLISKFGSPKEMLIHQTIRSGRFGGSVHIEEVNLIYPEKGVIIMFESQGGLDSIEISPNDPIIGILFFDPDNLTRTISRWILPYDELVNNNRVFPWMGYVTFEMKQ